MCGRYDFTPGEFSDLRIRFNLDKELPEFKPSYNISPGQYVPEAQPKHLICGDVELPGPLR
jgi:putative SOS response-associated peptidase YedK